jgi:hypothetical protein
MGNVFASPAATSATTTAQQMVTAISAALAANPLGVVSISMDGQTVTYSRKQALEELAFWEKRVARQSGARPRAAVIDLSGGFGLS